MSVKVMSLVWSAHLASPTLKLVLLKLADVSAEDGTRVYPSIPLISAETCICERSVQNAMKQLRDDGVISMVREGGGKLANEYKINLDKLCSSNPRTKCTGAADAPVQDMHSSGAPDAPPPRIKCTPPVQQMHPRGAPDAPLTTIQPSLNHHSTDARVWFDRFFKVYPKPEDEAKAWAAFEAQLAKGAAPEVLAATAELLAQQVAAGDIELRYVPNMLKFLQRGDWRALEKQVRQQDRAAATAQAKEAALEGWTGQIAIDKTLKRQWLAGVQLERLMDGRVRLLARSLMQRDYLRNQLFQPLCAGLRVQNLEVEVCQ